MHTAIPVMALNAYKRKFDISFLRKHFIILRASIRHIIRKINYKRRYYSRVLGLKQNKRPGIADMHRVNQLFIDTINRTGSFHSNLFIDMDTFLVVLSRILVFRFVFRFVFRIVIIIMIVIIEYSQDFI